MMGSQLAVLLPDEFEEDEADEAMVNPQCAVQTSNGVD